MFDLGQLLGMTQQPTAASTGDMTQGWGATVTPAGAAQANPLQSLLSGLSGFKGPEAVKPIMSGGASGPAAPRVDMSAAGQTPVMNALMQFIQGQQLNPLRVPTLGMMLGRGMV